MEKMDLSKKVLASLLTMSCVYLGGHPRSRWQRRLDDPAVSGPPGPSLPFGTLVARAPHQPGR